MISTIAIVVNINIY
jgi:hypothetical protein